MSKEQMNFWELLDRNSDAIGTTLFSIALITGITLICIFGK